MKINLTFLGTSQAIPTATRNHTSIFFTYKNEGFLIDCGEGTQRQFRKARLNPGKITRILITHWHGDHVLGLPGLLETLNLNGYQKTLHIYGPLGTKKFIKEIYKIFVPLGKIKLKVKEVENETFLETENFKVQTFPLKHSTRTNGYKFIEKDKLKIKKEKLNRLKLKKQDFPKLKDLTQKKDIKINNKIIKYKDYTYVEKGKNISFIFDTKNCPSISKLLKNCDLAVIESTYTSSEKDLAKQYNHMTAEEAAKNAKNAKIKELYLTHLSQRYEHKENTVLKEAKKYFKNTFIAHDLMKIQV